MERQPLQIRGHAVHEPAVSFAQAATASSSTSSSSALLADAPRFAAPQRDLRGVTLTLSLSQHPWSETMFKLHCNRPWPESLKDHILAWPSAQFSEDGQAVVFQASFYEEVEAKLQKLSDKGARLMFLPKWVRGVAGFGRKETHPLLGQCREDAVRQIHHYIQGLPEELRTRTPVLPYQVDGIAFGLHRGGRVLIGDEMGLGKTVQALILAAQFATEWPLLIVVPSSLRYVWRDQATQWLPHIVGPDGGLVHVVRNCKDRAPLGAHIIIVTYDMVRRCEQLRRRPDGRNFLAVIVDESQNIKDAGSQRAKVVVSICKTARRAILLSGTPALNRAAELYTQMESILPGEMPSFAQFADRFCLKKVQRFGRRTVEKMDGVQRAEELNILLSTAFMIRRLKKDVLSQLPAKRRMRVPLDPDRMNQDALREVERRVRMMSGKDLRAIGEELRATGKDSRDDGFGIPQMFRLTADAKLGAVVEYVEHLLQLRTKFLLFAHHHSILNALERKLGELGVDFIRIDGKTAPAQRPESVARFQGEDGVRVALLSITAAGVGLTLTAAQTVVFAELYWVPGQMQQAEDRAHRIGQRDCVTVQYLIAKGTLDDMLFCALEKKSKNTSAILDGKSRGLDAAASASAASAAVQAAPPRLRRDGPAAGTCTEEETSAPRESKRDELSPTRPPKRARHQPASVGGDGFSDEASSRPS